MENHLLMTYHAYIHPMMMITITTTLLILIARRDLPLLVPHRRSAAARGGVKVSDPVARDLVAFVVGEGEREAVGALELDVLAGEDEVGRLGRGAGGDGGGLGVDLDVDGVGDVVDGGGVGGGKRGLGPDERGHNALEQDLGVDERDAAERGVGGGLPVVVADDEHLQRVVGDGDFEERAGPVLASGVGVLEQGGDGDVDGFGAGVDERDHFLARDLAFDLVVDIGLVLHEDVEHGLVGDEVVGDVGLRLLVLEERDPRVGQGVGEALNVLGWWWGGDVNEINSIATQPHEYNTSKQLCRVKDLGLMSTILHPDPLATPSTFFGDM